MAQQNPFSEFFSGKDFSKLFGNYKSIPFDTSNLMETQRKNFQAITEAQQLAVQGLQAVAQKQGKIMTQIIQDNSSIASEMMAECTPEEKISKNTKLIKSVYERNIKNLEEISEILSKSNKEACSVINKRFAASMNELQPSQKADKSSKAA